MGRFRTLAINNEINYNDLYNRKKGIALIENARDLKICNNPSYKINVNTHNFYNYSDFSTYYTIANTYSGVNTECIPCLDYPLNLVDGLNSEICYDELIDDEDLKHPCIKFNLYKVDECIEEGTLYPYAKYNNKNNWGRLSYLHAKINPMLCEKLLCKKYKYCECRERHDCEKCLHLEYCECEKKDYKHYSKCEKCGNYKDKCVCKFTNVFPVNEKQSFNQEIIIEKDGEVEINKSVVDKEKVLESFSKFPMPHKVHNPYKENKLYIKNKSHEGDLYIKPKPKLWDKNELYVKKK